MPPKQHIGKQTYAVAKELANSDFISKADAAEIEDEVMGIQSDDPENSKSSMIERNLEQMIKVLHLRLTSISDTTKRRMDYCIQDLKPNSKLKSAQLPSGMNVDFDDLGPKFVKDTNRSTYMGHGKEINLVSTEGVFVDPQRLVLRTKTNTEAAKRVEQRLEETFGTVTLRDTKGQRMKTKTSKKSEAMKLEKKRQYRQKLEKELQVNIESFVTRSVMDPEMIFKIASPGEPIKWPIPLCWPSKDLRSRFPDNADGEMRPDILLRYALERISLPSGEGLFRWIVSKTSVQDYFVHLFWLIKVKFFQKSEVICTEEEDYLLAATGTHYVKIVDEFTQRALLEHEKDFIFRFFPYILTQAIFFGFYYLCPGSRHLYTKSFRKTVLLQVVQIIYGVQLCATSVKVMWAKLFPEEVEVDEGDVEEEVFPTNIAFPVDMRPSTGNLWNLDVTSKSTATLPPLTETLNSKAGILASDEATSDRPPLVPSSSDGALLSSSVRPLTTGSAKNSIKSEFLDTKFTGVTLIEPLARTMLARPPEKPDGPRSMLPRQSGEAMNAKYLSPLTQKFLASADPGIGMGIQRMTRTLPVSWCLTGGSDTHRKHPVPQAMHDELVRKGRNLARVDHMTTIKKQKELVKSIHDIEDHCKHILKCGNTTVAGYSLNIIKRRKQMYGRDSAASALVQPKQREEDELQGMKLSDLLEDDNLEDCLD
jgi:hypothetical protein